MCANKMYFKKKKFYITQQKSAFVDQLSKGSVSRD